MEKIESLLHQVSTNIQVLREAKKRLEVRYAPDFRLYDFMYINENGLSYCLASLLQPDGKHGQGTLYLKLFLQHLASAFGEVDSKALNGSQVVVEKTINDNRRIDIFIDIPNVGIVGIENKPWAADQHNQLHDYAEYLKKVSNSSDWLLVYLCNFEPSQASISQENREQYENSNKLKIMNFEKLNGWLKDSLNQTQPANVRFFIEEIMVFIDEKINSRIDMSEQKETAEILASSPENVEAAFSVINSIQEMKHDLMGRLRAELSDRLGRLGMQLEWEEKDDYSYAYFYFYISFGFAVPQELKLAFSFERRDLNQLIWGFSRVSDEVARDNTRWGEINTLMAERFGGNKQSDWWPWWAYAGHHLKSEYLDWKDNKEPWLAILNGSLVDEICLLAKEVKMLFKDSELLTTAVGSSHSS